MEDVLIINLHFLLISLKLPFSPCLHIPLHCWFATYVLLIIQVYVLFLFLKESICHHCVEILSTGTVISLSSYSLWLLFLHVDVDVFAAVLVSLGENRLCLSGVESCAPCATRGKESTLFICSLLQQIIIEPSHML